MNSRRASIAGLLVLFGAAAFLFRARIRAAALPLWEANAWIGDRVAGAGAFFASNARLQQENRALAQELADAKSKIAADETLLAAARELAPFLAARPFLAAPVLARPPQSPYDTLVVKGGGDLGITAGARAYAGGTLIGFVTSADANSSIVTLYSAPDQSVDLLLAKSQIQVTATGQGGGMLLAELPREIAVQEGESAAIPGEPQDIVGTVARVTLGQSDSFQKILIGNGVNLQETQWLRIRK